MVDWRFLARKYLVNRQWLPEITDRLSESPRTRLSKTKRDGFTFYYLRRFPPVSVCVSDQEWFYVLDKISGETAIDIGAHAGDYSLRLSKRFTTVIAFEPDPTNRYCLQTNLRINKVENVTVDPRAVSDKVGKAVLRRSSKVPSGSTLSSKHYDWVELDSSIEVDTVSLDGWIAANTHALVSFVKIDAENHELAVLKGAHVLLKRQRPLVGLEVHGPTEGLDQCICPSCSLLRSYDYVLETRKPSSDADAHWSLGRPVQIAFPNVDGRIAGDRP